MAPIDGDEHGRDGARADEIDQVGGDEPVDALEGLLDPDQGTNSPAGDAGAPAPG